MGRDAPIGVRGQDVRKDLDPCLAVVAAEALEKSGIHVLVQRVQPRDAVGLGNLEHVVVLFVEGGLELAELEVALCACCPNIFNLVGVLLHVLPYLCHEIAGLHDRARLGKGLEARRHGPRLLHNALRAGCACAARHGGTSCVGRPQRKETQRRHENASRQKRLRIAHMCTCKMTTHEIDYANLPTASAATL